MEAILNLSLKKDVFESLQSGLTNKIYIEKTNWWKKRLMDLDTGRFKKFDIARVSSGSSDKIEYDIEKIELVGPDFIIYVNTVRNDEPEPEHIDVTEKVTEKSQVVSGGSDEKILETPIEIEPEDSDFIWDDNPEDRANDEYIEEVIEKQQINPEIIEPVKVNPVVINEDGSVTQNYVLTEEQKKAIVEKYTKQILDTEKEEVSDVKTRVMKLIDSFCEQKDVFVVNMPDVTIRFNGQIIGYHGGRRLIADRDSDVKLNFKNYELIMYYDMSDDDFILEVQAFLNQLLKNNYVFINRKYCDFYTTTNDELILRVTAIAKKKYLFR